MAFYAANFAYDGKMSSDYGLIITSEGSGEGENAGASVTLHVQEIYRRPKPYLLGVQQSPVLEIPVKINVSGELSAMEDSAISSWLFGSMGYKKLQILQPDMQYVYFNCIFKDKSTIRVGNIIRGYTATIVCDGPFAWESAQRTFYKDYNSANSGIGLVTDEIVIVNSSDNADYTFPSLSFSTNNGQTPYLQIINTTDSASRAFFLSPIESGGPYSIDNDLQIISSGDYNMFPAFVHYNEDGTINNDTSYNWLRLVKGKNILNISGYIRDLTISFRCARKIS